jgi:hypothetical protein
LITSDSHCRHYADISLIITAAAAFAALSSAAELPAAFTPALMIAFHYAIAIIDIFATLRRHASQLANTS